MHIPKPPWYEPISTKTDFPKFSPPNFNRLSRTIFVPINNASPSIFGSLISFGSNAYFRYSNTMLKPIEPMLKENGVLIVKPLKVSGGK